MQYRLRPSWLGFVALGFYCLILGGIAAGGWIPIVVLAHAIKSSDGSSALLWLIFVGMIARVVSIFFPYMINSFVYFIEIENAGICFRPGFRTVRVDIRDLDSVSLLGGGRGWRYIGLFTKGRVEVITNSLYSDRAFDELSGKISEWMGSNGKADRVLTGDNGPGKLGQRSFRRVGAIYYLVAYLALASLATIVLLAF